MKSPYIMLLISSAAASTDCCIDETQNTLGSGLCYYSEDCQGDRWCTSSGACDGEANCSSGSCIPTTAVELPDNFDSEIVVKSHTNLNINDGYITQDKRRNAGACFYIDPSQMVSDAVDYTGAQTSEYKIVTAERTNNTAGNDCLEFEFSKMGNGQYLSGDMFSLKAKDPFFGSETWNPGYLGYYDSSNQWVEGRPYITTQLSSFWKLHRLNDGYAMESSDAAGTGNGWFFSCVGGAYGSLDATKGFEDVEMKVHPNTDNAERKTVFTITPQVKSQESLGGSSLAASASVMMMAIFATI